MLLFQHPKISLLSNPKTSLLLVFLNANSCFLTASRCISLKSKRLVQFDPLQKSAFSVLLSYVVSKLYIVVHPMLLEYLLKCTAVSLFGGATLDSPSVSLLSTFHEPLGLQWFSSMQFS